ncbi:MAG: 2,3-diaminopropionate biosynthesis protein SbnB [Pyrinomonadaceae bacterium]|nr:2,3-diaminopropionate biosynthesis protein SbnB [Pyrinomonadaceae bacterium]
MPESDILLLKGSDVATLLEGRELELIQTVRQAYETHRSGDSSLPHSTFLHFPDESCNRIIALPAYLGHEFDVAGIKWVASFPNNLKLGSDRASAVVILNSADTGKPEAIIEGSIINAKRTAASAVLAAQCLWSEPGTSSAGTSVGMMGCGLINFEIARFLRAGCPTIRRFVLFDLDETRARSFGQRCSQTFGDIEVEIAADMREMLRSSSLISMATTAAKPHISELPDLPPGSTILHVSLRDLAPEIVLSCENIVDDIDHVCRAQTSLHLTEQQVGRRDFIRGTLADVLTEAIPARERADATTVFSPFGLGILDLAVGKLVRDLGRKQERGTLIKSFLPDSWSEMDNHSFKSHTMEAR